MALPLLDLTAQALPFRLWLKIHLQEGIDFRSIPSFFMNLIINRPSKLRNIKNAPISFFEKWFAIKGLSHKTFLKYRVAII